MGMRSRDLLHLQWAVGLQLPQGRRLAGLFVLKAVDGSSGPAYERKCLNQKLYFGRKGMRALQHECATRTYVHYGQPSHVY